MNLASTFGSDAPIIGMVHLDPLPGAPGATNDLAAVIDDALTDARALEAGGVDAIMIENLGDAPYYPDDVPKHVVAAMARAVTAISRATDLPSGVNVLRNDAEAALAVAAATEGSFIRVNVHTGVRVTDQGIIEGRAHEIVRLRDRIAPDVAILADFGVKHSTSVTGERPTAQSFHELADRGMADGVIVSGAGTGKPTDLEWIRTVAEWRSELGETTPIVVGSGVDHESVTSVLEVADGAIVGTALKDGGEVHGPVDEERVATLVESADRVR